MKKKTSFFLISLAALLLAACSFDYSAATESDKNKPDIVMEELEYVRVRGGDPLVRFRAEYAERWEDRQTMELRNFSFEQMEDQGETINAEGKAGSAVVQISSGDLALSGGVRIRMESEDIVIMTGGLEWKDKDKLLFGGEHDEVDIERSDGTSFSGTGFSADIRNRTWTFSGEVKGRYVEKDDKEKDEETPDEVEESEESEESEETERAASLSKDIEEEPEQFFPIQEKSVPTTEPPSPKAETRPVPSVPAPSVPTPSVPEDK